MLRKVFASLALIACGITQIQCSNSSDGNNTTSFSLISFSPANRWQYKIEWKDPYSQNSMVAYDIVTVSPKSITISGEIWDTVIHNSYQNAIPDFFPLMTNRADGTWVRWDTIDHPHHLFKYPAFVGESWKVSPADTTGPDQYLNKSQMVSVEPVKIGSQTYLCNVYQYLVAGGHEGQIRNIYIAPGFTIVKGVYITSRSSSWDTATYTLVQ